MNRTTWIAGSFFLAGGLVVATLAHAADRPADTILTEIRAVEIPQIAEADRSDRVKVREFLLKRQAAMERKAGLIGELYQQHPDNPELTQLMPERWQVLMAAPKTADAAKTEMDKVIATSKNDAIVKEASFLQFVMMYRQAGKNPPMAPLLAKANLFLERFPKDERGPSMLAALANATDDEARKAAINARLEKEFPDSAPVQAMIAERRLKEAVGKPFPIAFTDAIKGTKIDSASLKGKVVIVDFWATWCGPCVAEMPKMKSLYAEYKDKGVEFVGISLDSPKEEGGLDKLTAFVAKNGIEWPQYYQGNGWESEFSKSWGINSIPAVFAVDADGNLATIEARGKLETLIPELLEKAGKVKKAE